MEKMYPPVVNSPKTELTELITDKQTEITVANASVLLQGEGIAVLGNGDVAETITYTSVEDNVLKGCVRGFEGVARAWPVGTRIARNFTAADWRAAINNIQALHDESSSESRKPITLQPGVQIVKTDKQAVFNLAGLTGKTVIDYEGQKGLFGVRNPYVIRYGENLLPSFFEWSAKQGTPTIMDEKSISVTVDNKIVHTVSRLVPGQKYTVSVQSGGATGRITVTDEPETKVLAEAVGAGLLTATFTAGQAVNIRLLGTSATAVTMFNPMLNIGSTAKPFKPREDSMLALQTDLYADPVTGLNADTVFERDGQYFKSKKWQGLTLDGNLAWVYFDKGTGYKVVRLPITDGLSDRERVSKYDGKLIPHTFPVSGADQSYLSESAGVLGLSISVADSGWGDNYTPTADEIKAYFMGWKMKQFGAGDNVPYTSGTKEWVQILNPVATNTTTLPVIVASNYTPYQLVYQLATPMVEPIVSEGQLTFTEGDNQVEVGTGIILREKAKLYLEADTKRWNINNGSPGQYQASLLDYRVNRFIGIYRNSQRDNWILYPNTTTPAGALAQLPSTAYDANAAYTVSYLAFITSPVVPFTGSYAANEKSLLLDLVDTVQQNTTRVSVLENMKAEKDNPAWIAPTLLNGTTNTNSGEQAVQYVKTSDGQVLIRGVMTVTALNLEAFKLPTGYRPTKGMRFVVSANGAFGQVVIGTDGAVKLSVGSLSVIDLSGITFQAEL